MTRLTSLTSLTSVPRLTRPTRLAASRSHTLFAVLAVAAFSASPAAAQAVTIGIQGDVTNVFDPGLLLVGIVSPGQSVTGNYTYELSTPDSDPSIDSAVYHNTAAPAGIVLNFPAFVIRSDPADIEFEVALKNDFGNPPVDVYDVNSFFNVCTAPGIEAGPLNWELVDLSTNALNSTALPATAPNLAQWPDGNQLFIEADPIAGQQWAILVTVTSTTLISGPTLQGGQRQAGSAGFFPIHRSGLGGFGPGIGHSGGSNPATFFTIVSVTNTDTQPQTPQSLGGSTNVHYEYVNVTPGPTGDPFLPQACTIFDRVEFLTPADTLSVLTNCHNAVAPGGQQGYLVVSAQDPSVFDTDWSHNDLMGGELVVNNSGGMYEVAMVSFASPIDDGEPTDLPDQGTGEGNGQLDFDGLEYAALPDEVYIDSFIAFAGSHLTLANFTGGLSARNTLRISAWNDNEFAMSATRTFACWFDQPLQVVSPLFTNNFLAQNTPDDPGELDVDCNGTGDIETAWARIDSIDVSFPFGGQIATDGAVLGAVTAGPGSMIDGGTLLWESKASQANGSFGP